jgi:hypothetical protein
MHQDFTFQTKEAASKSIDLAEIAQLFINLLLYLYLAMHSYILDFCLISVKLNSIFTYFILTFKDGTLRARALRNLFLGFIGFAG